MSESVDIAIIGGGSSGLNLARNLCQLQPIPSAVVIEPKTPQERECSWALWSKQTDLQHYRPALKGSWPAWQIIDPCRSITHHGSEYQYHSLSAGRFLAYCESQLREPVSLRRDSVKQVQIDGDIGLITTENASINAKHIYDSRPVEQPENALKQHFLGWEIITKKPIQNPQIAILMDFRVDQSQGVHFIYMLPFTSQHLLVESTLVSRQLQHKSWYRTAIQTWLQDRGIEVSQQVGEEYGVIPLEDHPISSNSIGAASGAIRRSSGYAFTTIQKQTRQLAENIAMGDYTIPQPVNKGLKMMDTIFNDVLVNHPNLGTEIFMRTAKALTGDQFARFMLGEANTYIWAKVIAAMPKLPFIKQMILRKNKRVALEQY